MNIRAERPEDQSTIRALTEQAFEPMSYSDGTESQLIDSLRRESALTLSLVAEDRGEVVGHIAFSPASSACETECWFALGPVSVRPNRQRTGIGSALIKHGLTWLGELRAAGCILVGNPEYYGRFGFVVTPERCPPGQPSQYFMVNQISETSSKGPIQFHSAFSEH